MTEDSPHTAEMPTPPPVSLAPLDPANTVEVDGAVTTEHTPEATEADRVYLSISFPNLDREVAAEIVEATRAIAGQVSFSVYYDVPSVAEETPGG